jgi:hypothetical protein
LKYCKGEREMVLGKYMPTITLPRARFVCLVGGERDEKKRMALKEGYPKLLGFVSFIKVCHGKKEENE